MMSERTVWTMVAVGIVLAVVIAIGAKIVEWMR